MTTTTNNTTQSPPLGWAITGGKMDYFSYMLENEMERIESLSDSIEADSAPVEQLPEIEINWETMENF